jgi:hypothetical protein
MFGEKSEIMKGLRAWVDHISLQEMTFCHLRQMMLHSPPSSLVISRDDSSSIFICTRAKEIFDVPVTRFCFDETQWLIDESQFDVKWNPTVITKQVRSMETP